MQARRVSAAFEPGGGPVAAEFAYPGGVLLEPKDSKSRAVGAGISAGLHFGGLAILLIFASLAPVIDDELIPVQLLRDDPPAPDEPAPARRALAERRALDYAPAIQAVQPQIVNPRVISEAAPAIAAESLQMDAVSAVAAPTQINRSSTVVERVSAVRSIAAARASAVDVARVGGPAVRGPVRANAAVGPSVGPRKVAGATGGSFGTGTLAIGGGSSVREGVVSGRDVLGSPDGAPLVSVNTAVGEGLMGAGTGGSGRGGSGGTGTGEGSCFGRPEVQSYLSNVENRTLDRWVLPPGLAADQKVTLQFKLDVAGSASRVKLVAATDNGLGASAVDALRAASPFPPMPDTARCLAQTPITATFSNPGAS